MTRLAAALLVCATPVASLETSLRGAEVSAGGARRGLSGSSYEAYEHVGCYVDNGMVNARPHLPLVMETMTNEMCYDRCHELGSFFMGTQKGNECRCSREEDLAYSAFDFGVCDIPCAGDSDETCGGQLTIDLYKLTAAQTPDHEEYVGCWSDANESRVMEDMLVDEGMTTDMCRDHCESSDAVYYATQYGNECFCGYSSDPEDYETHGLGTCHMHCGGDSGSACGGYWAFSLYQFGADGMPEPDVPESTPEPTPEPTPESTPEPTPEPVSSGGGGGDVSGGEYGITFNGEGTYYTGTSAGNCGFFDDFPSIYDGMTPVALNEPQYGDSLMCGACVEGEGTGGGSGSDPVGTFKGFIMDKCPECSEGDLDFGTGKDGRWDIKWKFVECPAGEEVSFKVEQKTEYYWKIQPRGTATPVESLTIGGRAAARTDDNHFELEHPSGDPWYEPQMVVTTTVGGVVEETEMSV